LKVKVAASGASPLESTTFSPGQGNSAVTELRASFTGPIWAIEKTAIRIRYGA